MPLLTQKYAKRPGWCENFSQRKHRSSEKETQSKIPKKTKMSQ